MKLCQGCATELSTARLAALPGVTLCVRCAQKPYVRPDAPEFPPGNWRLLEDATEAPVLRLAEPERRAEERAANLTFRQIQGLTEVVEYDTLNESKQEETHGSSPERGPKS